MKHGAPPLALLALLFACTDGPIEPSGAADSPPTARAEVALGPGAGRIAFASNRDDALRDVFLMDANGANVTKIAGLPNAADDDPSISPDGSKVAFYRGGRIHVVDLATGVVTPLSSPPRWRPTARTGDGRATASATRASACAS